MSFLAESLSVLVAANVGEYNTNLFLTSNALIPPGDGPFISLIGTGGTVEATHNSRDLPAYVKASLQLYARGANYQQTEQMLMAGLAALHPITNKFITPFATALADGEDVRAVWWLSVLPLQVVPLDLGKDVAGRANLSLNFLITRRLNAAKSS